MDSKFYFLVIILALSLTLISFVNSSVAIEYKNYSSDNYNIQFQYPSTWEIKEKSGRFDEGASITITNPTLVVEKIQMNYYEDAKKLMEIPNIQIATEVALETAIEDSYLTENEIIEDPSYLIIDGQGAGTFVHAWKDKLENFPIRYAAQTWNVFANNHYYVISFSSTTDVFDSPENIQIRDQFIKSIKFLDESNYINANSTDLMDLLNK